MLEDYTKAYPGASDIIIELARTELNMAVAEQRHRHDLESKESNAYIELARRGQHYAAAIAGSCIVLGAVVMVVGMLTNQAGIAVTGAGLILGVVVALTVVFVTGRESQAKAQADTGRSPRDTTPPGDGQPTS